jgi:hypothetical protein
MQMKLGQGMSSAKALLNMQTLELVSGRICEHKRVVSYEVQGSDGNRRRATMDQSSI